MSGVLYHECGYVAGGVGEWRPLTLVPLPARAVLLSPTALTAYTTETRSGLTSRAFAFPNLTGTATCMEAWRDHQTGFNFLVVAGYEVPLRPPFDFLFHSCISRESLRYR
eukprot:m.489250 g.489250  ORF g.489250 m.489250 type:complete len:110 (+) comp57235_c0_seq39:2073-2402(+)